MKKTHDLAVVIGRFQPFHYGHLKLLQEAAQLADRILILVGSCGGPRSIKNPFTWLERAEIIGSLQEHSHVTSDVKIDTMYLSDRLYNDNLWVEQVQKAVDEVKDEMCQTPIKVVLVGHKKDDSSYYLNMFPAYDYHEVKHEPIDEMDATSIRSIMFEHKMLPSNQTIPDSVLAWLATWKRENPEDFQQLCEEYAYIKDYKSQWGSAPFQPIFVTTDAVVICSGHILLVKRRTTPGKGLWALPGGFLDPNEPIEASMLRELTEETRIKVDRATLINSIKFGRVFDHPNRSLRGRTITHAYLLNLGWGPLPRVRGSDDAERAKWFPINTFLDKMTNVTFEDHWDIANTLITA